MMYVAVPTLLFDTAGRVITFEEGLAPGQRLHSAGEELWLLREGCTGLAASTSERPKRQTLPS